MYKFGNKPKSPFCKLHLLHVIVSTRLLLRSQRRLRTDERVFATSALTYFLISKFLSTELSHYLHAHLKTWYHSISVINSPCLSFHSTSDQKATSSYFSMVSWHCNAMRQSHRAQKLICLCSFSRRHTHETPSGQYNSISLSLRCCSLLWSRAWRISISQPACNSS